MPPRNTQRFMRAAVRAIASVARVGLRLVAGAIGVLASNARTEPANDELSHSVRGGVLNYRTGKLDDGTDPVGWYERD
mgnify:CR=1 FL=1